MSDSTLWCVYCGAVVEKSPHRCDVTVHGEAGAQPNYGARREATSPAAGELINMGGVTGAAGRHTPPKRTNP